MNSAKIDSMLKAVEVMLITSIYIGRRRHIDSDSDSGEAAKLTLLNWVAGAGPPGQSDGTGAEPGCRYRYTCHGITGRW